MGGEQICMAGCLEGSSLLVAAAALQALGWMRDEGQQAGLGCAVVEGLVSCEICLLCVMLENDMY
jgi:hypothetical protein